MNEQGINYRPPYQIPYKAPCFYHLRLVGKLKSLDMKGKLNLSLIEQAINWARHYHSGSLRKSGEPYYTHPLEVAYIACDYNLTTNVIVTSILHDIVEDTEVTIGMIESAFGTRVACMVDMLTRDRPDGTKLTIEEVLNNVYQHDDKEVLLIKLIDRLHNIQTIESMGTEKRQKIIYETLVNFIIGSMILESLELEQQLVESCVRFKYGQESKSKLRLIKTRFSFNANLSYLPDLSF